MRTPAWNGAAATVLKPFIEIPTLLFHHFAYCAPKISIRLPNTRLHTGRVRTMAFSRPVSAYAARLHAFNAAIPLPRAASTVRCGAIFEVVRPRCPAPGASTLRTRTTIHAVDSRVSRLSDNQHRGSPKQRRGKRRHPQIAIHRNPPEPTALCNTSTS